MSQQEIVNLLSEMVKIPSISSDKDHRDDVDASAQFVENLFADLGLNTQVVKVAGGMPAVVAHTALFLASDESSYMTEIGRAHV